MERDLKVLAVIDSLTLGGAERLLATLARAAPSASLVLEVVSIAEEAPDRRLMIPMLESAGLRPQLLPVTKLVDPSAIVRLARVMRRSRCDVVHAHLEYAATLAPLAARLARRPAVCTFHHVPGPLPLREAVKERLAVRVAGHSARVIFPSEASMHAFAQRYPRGHKRWVVVHNGVDLSEFAPRRVDFPANLGIPAGAPVAILVGAMRRPKGHAQALAAWAMVAQRVPGARLLFVGSGPEEQRLRAQAAALGIAELVIFAGLRADVAQLMSAATLVVLPAETEALPTTLVEAAAAGKAVVATDVEGVPEVVIHDVTGVLVPSRDAHALARAVTTLLLDEQRRARMEIEARMLAERRFDMYEWAGRLRSVYEGAVTGRPLEHGDRRA